MSRADDHFDMDEWLGSRSRPYYKVMIVEFNTGGANYIPVRQATPQRTAVASTDDSSVSFSSQSLQDTMKQSSAQSRPEKVAQAAALLNQGNYPSDSALNQLAGFLAERL